MEIRTVSSPAKTSQFLVLTTARSSINLAILEAMITINKQLKIALPNRIYLLIAIGPLAVEITDADETHIFDSPDSF